MRIVDHAELAQHRGPILISAMYVAKGNDPGAGIHFVGAHADRYQGTDA